MEPAVTVAIVAASILLASLLVSLALFLLNLSVVRSDRRQQKKEIVYSVVQDEHLLADEWEFLRKGFSVTFAGGNVAEPRLAAVEILNSGSVELTGERIEYWRVRTPDAEIVHAWVGRVQDESTIVEMQGSSVVDRCALDVCRVALNPGQKLIVRLFVDGGDRPPMVELQLAGFPSKRKSIAGPKRRAALTWFLRLAVLAAVIAAEALLIAVL